MPRAIALTVAAAALALPAAAPAAAEDCVGNNALRACVYETCYDHHCIQRTYTVYTDCRPPLPAGVCAAAEVRFTTPRDFG